MPGIRKVNFRREREFDISLCKGHDNAFSEYTSVGRVFPYAVHSDKEKSTTRLCHDSSSSRYFNILLTSIAPATTDVSSISRYGMPTTIPKKSISSTTTTTTSPSSNPTTILSSTSPKSSAWDVQLRSTSTSPQMPAPDTQSSNDALSSIPDSLLSAKDDWGTSSYRNSESHANGRRSKEQFPALQ